MTAKYFFEIGEGHDRGFSLIIYKGVGQEFPENGKHPPALGDGAFQELAPLFA